MLEYSGFILVNRNTLGPYIFVRCHRMLENSGVGLYKFYCICNKINDYWTWYTILLLFLKVAEYERITKDVNRSAYTKRIMEIVSNIKKQKDGINQVT